MTNKPKAQGTAWETVLTILAQDIGLMAGRFPEGGANDVGDVWIGDLPRKGSPNDIAALAWSRLVKAEGPRRHADGVRSVVILETGDFLRLALAAVEQDFAFTVECKATERLNVTRTLDQAQRKLRRWKER